MKTFVKTITTLMLGMALGSATLAAAAPATVKAVIAEFKIVVNGETKALSKSPIVVDGTTYLPVREVANLVGVDLNYDGANKKIELSTKGESPVISNTANTISFRDLVNVLDKKYPDKNVGLSADGLLYIGDEKYELSYEKSSDGTLLVTTQDLIDLGLITIADIQ